MVTAPVLETLVDQFGRLDAVNPGGGISPCIALGNTGLHVNDEYCVHYGPAHADGVAEQWQHCERLPSVVQLEGSGSQGFEYRTAEIGMTIQLLLQKPTRQIAKLQGRSGDAAYHFDFFRVAGVDDDIARRGAVAQPRKQTAMLQRAYPHEPAV